MCVCAVCVCVCPVCVCVLCVCVCVSSVCVCVCVCLVCVCVCVLCVCVWVLSVFVCLCVVGRWGVWWFGLVRGGRLCESVVGGLYARSAWFVLLATVRRVGGSLSIA